jgi:ABC-type transport auxiliary lipoprotein component
LEVVGGQASLQAAYEIAADADQASASRRQWVTMQVPSGPTALQAARAYSALLGQLADRIAADLASPSSVR